MRVILLGDLHMGARGGDLDFVRYFNKFFTDVLFPYMKKNNISYIVQAGDYFDNQTSVDTTAWRESKPVWINELQKNNFQMAVLVGNHDIAYRNTLRVNTPELILSEFDNIQVIKEPTTLTLKDGYSFDIVPWICEENKEEIFSFIEKQASSVLVGHFSIEGFPMFKGGAVEKKGLSRSLFENYPFVFSGHFHSKSSGGNIDYLGVPYEITWADYSDPKGFHVFDTVNQTVEFVVNPHTMFEKISYSEDLDLDTIDIQGKIVKVIVKNRGDLNKYNKFLEKIKSIGTKDLIIEEQVNDTSKVSDTDLTEIDWVEDKILYIEKAVESATTDLDKDTVVSYMSDLHQRSLAL